MVPSFQLVYARNCITISGLKNTRPPEVSLWRAGVSGPGLVGDVLVLGPGPVLDDLDLSG